MQGSRNDGRKKVEGMGKVAGLSSNVIRKIIQRMDDCSHRQNGCKKMEPKGTSNHAKEGEKIWIYSQRRRLG